MDQDKNSGKEEYDERMKAGSFSERDIGPGFSL